MRNYNVTPSRTPRVIADPELRREVNRIWEAINPMDRYLKDSSRAFARITDGQIPDGSGTSLATSIVGVELSRVNDTNVTLTLGGSPTTALLAATSITAGWTGQLAVGRGGTGASTLTGILQGNGISAFTAIANSSTVGQVLRVTGASTYAWGALDLDDIDAVTGTLGVANGGTDLASGTSGGILGFTGTTTLASSALLTLNGVVIGGGAGATPTSTAAGTSSQVLRGGAPPTFGSAPAAAIIHTILDSSYHSDTTTSAVQRGDLIIGKGVTPKWERHTVGAATTILISSGVDPVWSTTKWTNSATTGDILYASAANTYSNLAAVATGNALISGGVGAAPSWGKIGIGTHLSGVVADQVLYGSTGNVVAQSANFTWNGSLLAVAASDVLIDNNKTYRIKDTGGVSRRVISLDSSGDLFVGNQAGTTRDMILEVGSAEGIRIKQTTGLVGVGTGSTVSGKFHVTGTSVASNLFRVDGSTTATFALSIAPTTLAAANGEGGISFAPVVEPADGSTHGNIYGNILRVAMGNSSTGNITNMFGSLYRYDQLSTYTATATNVYVLAVDFPSINASSTKPTNLYGLWIYNQGLSVNTLASGIFVNAQSGATYNYEAIFAGTSGVVIGRTPGAATADATFEVSGSQSGFNAIFNRGSSSTGDVQIRGASDSNLLFADASADRIGIGESAPDYKLDINGTLGFTPGASVTPVDNGDVVIEATNNTTLTFKLKGSDGTVRSGTLTLA